MLDGITNRSRAEALDLLNGPIQDEVPPSWRGTHASTPAPAAIAPAEVGPSSTPMPTSLSPEALMAYCESRLQSIDSQMNGIFTQQQQNSTATSDVNALAGLWNDLTPTSDSPPNYKASSQQLTGIAAAYQLAINASAPSATSASLLKDQAQFNALTSPISNSDMSQLTQNLKNYASDLNSNSEMSMITLQSLMSQRQTAIQLTTNLVQSLGDQASSIAKNIGQ